MIAIFPSCEQVSSIKLRDGTPLLARSMLILKRWQFFVCVYTWLSALQPKGLLRVAMDRLLSKCSNVQNVITTANAKKHRYCKNLSTFTFLKHKLIQIKPFKQKSIAFYLLCYSFVRYIYIVFVTSRNNFKNLKECNQMLQ